MKTKRHAHTNASLFASLRTLTERTDVLESQVRDLLASRAQPAAKPAGRPPELSLEKFHADIIENLRDSSKDMGGEPARMSDISRIYGRRAARFGGIASVISALAAERRIIIIRTHRQSQLVFLPEAWDAFPENIQHMFKVRPVDEVIRAHEKEQTDMRAYLAKLSEENAYRERYGKRPVGVESCPPHAWDALLNRCVRCGALKENEL